jgi:hypothetical protein
VKLKGGLIEIGPAGNLPEIDATAAAKSYLATRAATPYCHKRKTAGPDRFFRRRRLEIFNCAASSDGYV